MKKIIAVLIMVMALSVVLNAKKDDGKKKGKDKNTTEFYLMLDDSRMNPLEEQIKYANSLASVGEEVLATVQDALGALGNNFSPIKAQFDAAQEETLLAKEMLMQALGIREKVVEAIAEAKATDSGNAGQIFMDKSAQADEIISEMAEDTEELSEVQKAWIRSGLIRMGTSVLREAALVKAVADYISYVDSLPALSKAKEAKNLPEATLIAKDLPGILGTQVKSLGSLIKIAKTNNIKIPAQVKLP
ncbi:MAG: hypothetical protein GXY81_00705 [Candidatus Cloacimonetes bacterium]|nr:hypothetical protein [Candidatus Cloacimonadota bacterium]